METPEERKRRLYGPIRNLQVENIRKTLSKSHVLQDGEYNLTKLKDSNFNTSYFTDYPGAVLDASGTQEPKGQLTHHFALGNDSGNLIPKETYSESTTKSDFPVKEYNKAEAYEAERVINWPDMAPRYMSSRKVADSEYVSSFIPQGKIRNEAKVGPLYPRVDTSKMKLPLDPNRFWRQRNTSIVMGSDRPDIFSESQRVYGTGNRDGTTPQLAFSQTDAKAGQDVSKQMKDLERSGHVFRFGDYNAVTSNYNTTVNEDFGPRTLPPAEHATLALKLAEKKAKEQADKDGNTPVIPVSDALPGDNERINHLAAYARSTTVPNVFKDASEGRDYQTTAHFHFGSDPNTVHTVYGKDYTLGAMAKRGPPQKIVTPAAEHLLQNDPEYRPIAPTSSQVDYGFKPTPNPKNSQGKTLLDINMGLHKTDHIIMTYDQSRHWDDRQKSLAHSDYVRHRQYKPAEPAMNTDIQYDFLTQNDILQHEPSDNNTSEAKNNFTGAFMEGSLAADRSKTNKKECKVRFDDNRSTHFIVGYNPKDFASETMVKYRGEGKTDKDIPPAGKTERKQPGKPKHISMSENTEDLQAADPYAVVNMETLMAQHHHVKPDGEHAFRTSVMKADFTPLNRRKVTDAQVRTMVDCDKKVRKDMANSHLFHTDNSGRNNYLTTAMDDYIKPENMAGQKFLLAR